MTATAAGRPKPQLVSPHRYKERMLLFGNAGVGKSTAVGSIASRVPDAKFWVIDTDVSAAYHRMIYGQYPWTEQQFEIMECDTWQQYVDATKRVADEADPAKDWWVIDNVSWTWEEVQAFYSEEVHGTDIHEHMLELRKASADAVSYGRAVAAEGNWQIINAVYKREVYTPMARWGGHLVLIAEAQAMSSRDKGDSELADFTPYGILPKGQKKLPYVASSNLLLTKRGAGARAGYAVTTIKDRTRAELDGEPIDDFAMDYLGGVGGWDLSV